MQRKPEKGRLMAKGQSECHKKGTLWGKTNNFRELEGHLPPMHPLFGATVSDPKTRVFHKKVDIYVNKCPVLSLLLGVSAALLNVSHFHIIEWRTFFCRVIVRYPLKFKIINKIYYR